MDSRDAYPARIPPHNLDAERAVLGAMVLEGPSVLPRVSALVSSDFYADHHGTLFGVMLELGAAGVPIDTITLADELHRRDLLDFVGGPPMLALVEADASIRGHLDRYVRIVREKAILREIIQTSTHAMTWAFDEHDDPQLLLDRAREAFEIVARRAIVAEKPFPAMTAAELLTMDIKDPPFIVDKWIPAATMTLVVGDSEAYKSWFTGVLALSVAAGRPFLAHFPVRQTPTLLISEENGIAEDRRRIALLFRGLGLHPPDVPFHVASDAAFSFDNPAKYNAMRAYCQEHRIGAVVFDSFVRMHRREEKDAGQMSALYTDRVKPMNRDGIAVVILHHKRKMPSGFQAAAGGNGNDDIRGSGDLRASAHAVLILRKVGNDGKVVVEPNKARGWKKPESYVFELKDCEDTRGAYVTMTYAGKPVEALDKRDACRLAILEYAAAQTSRTFTQTELDSYFKAQKAAGKASFSRKIYGPILKDLAKDAYPLKADKGGRTVFYRYVTDDDAGELDEPGSNDAPF